jgi:hypothetical protein
MRQGLVRVRIAGVVAAAAVGVGALGAAAPAFGYVVDPLLAKTSAGTVAVTCDTPNAAGAEASPSASSGGVTLPTVSTPSLTVPPVTIGQVQVGPESAGPYTVGGYTIPSISVGGQTIGKGGQPDEVAGVGATNCAAVNVSNPSSATVLSGSIYLALFVEGVNPSTGQTAFVPWSQGTPVPLKSTPTTVGVDLAVGQATDAESGVPTTGNPIGASGYLSTGLAEYYAGVPLSVNGLSQPTGLGCQTGDASCSTSAPFPVF